jgi:hypothetical protein
MLVESEGFLRAFHEIVTDTVTEHFGVLPPNDGNIYLARAVTNITIGIFFVVYTFTCAVGGGIFEFLSGHAVLGVERHGGYETVSFIEA